MRISKYPSPLLLREAPTGKLLDLWEITNTAEYSPMLAIVRGWLLDELEIQNPEGFNAWLDQDVPMDEDLRQFIIQ